ncbi:MAG TPA: GAF domain-containing protein [Terriglobales bacterium]|nr:GAF domain-containing protein [Terriglobales bacterium]
MRGYTPLTFLRLSTRLQTLHLTHDPFEIARAAYEELSRPVGVDLFFNYLVVKPGTDLWLASFDGVPYQAGKEIRTLKFNEAVCGTVAATGRAMNIGYSDPADPKASLVRAFGAKAYCCTPILNGSRLMGTLSFGSTTREAFNTSEATLMKLAAQQIALGLSKRFRSLYEGVPLPVQQRAS